MFFFLNAEAVVTDVALAMVLFVVVLKLKDNIIFCTSQPFFVFFL